MRCSVVCGVMLRLLVINISSPSLAINTAAYYQRCVTTSGTLAMLHQQLCWQHLACCSANSCDFCLSHCIRRPRYGGSRRNIATLFGMEKLEWRGYQMVKKIAKVCLFVLTWSMNVTDTQRDRQMDGQTDTTWRHRPRLYIASRGKN